MRPLCAQGLMESLSGFYGSLIRPLRGLMRPSRLLRGPCKALKEGFIRSLREPYKDLKGAL